MAQTTGIVNATLFKIYVGSNAIGCLTDISIDFSQSFRDTTCKDSGGDETFLPSTRSWSASGSGYHAEDATYGFDDLYAAYIAGTQLTIKYSSEIVGNKLYTGTAYIENLSRSGQFEDNEQFSVTFKGVGAVTESTGA